MDVLLSVVGKKNDYGLPGALAVSKESAEELHH